MSATAKSLGIDKLAVGDRLNLIDEILASVARDADAFPLSDSQRAELDWRIADDDTHPSDVVPWDEAKGLARALFAK